MFVVHPDGTNMQLILNVGGPDRLSRLQMAETVAAVRGYELSLLKPVSASTVSLPYKLNPISKVSLVQVIYLPLLLSLLQFLVSQSSYYCLIVWLIT